MMLKKINLIITQCSHHKMIFTISEKKVKLSFNPLPNTYKNNPYPTSSVTL